GFISRGGHVNRRLHGHSGRSELAGRREERLIAGHGLKDTVFPILDVENDLQGERLMVFLAEQFVSGWKVVAQFHLQTFKGLDELHRVLAPSEFRLLHADFKRVHRLIVRLHIAIRQRTGRIDFRQACLSLIKKPSVLWRVEWARLNRNVAIDADETLDFVPERRKIGGLSNGAVTSPFVLLGEPKIEGLVTDGHAIFAEKDAEQPVERAGNL